MTLNPLIPYLPAFVSFLIYGAITSGLFSFGRRVRFGCLLALLYWYGFVCWCAFFLMLLIATTRTNLFCFVFGVLLPFLPSVWGSYEVQKTILIVSDVFSFVGRVLLRVWTWWQDWQQATTNEPSSEPKAKQSNTKSAGDRQDEETAKRERDRREAEARARREQTERTRQEEQRGKQSSAEPRGRTPEEVLGLKPPWTVDDLKNAYRREAGRTHPDKWVGKPETIRQAMEEEYKAIQEAYKKLKP